MPTRSFESSIDIDPQIFNMLTLSAQEKSINISDLANEILFYALNSQKMDIEIQAGIDQAENGDIISNQELKQQIQEFKQQFLS